MQLVVQDIQPEFSNEDVRKALQDNNCHLVATANPDTDGYTQTFTISFYADPTAFVSVSLNLQEAAILSGFLNSAT